jgi:HEAT repeat protein
VNKVKNQEDIDVKRISLDIIRDFYSASRKLVMYPLGHPNTNDTLKKSVERLNEIFSIKRSFVIQTFAGRLLAEGIILEDNVFVSGLLLDLKKHNLNSVVFNCDLILGDLYHLLSKMVEPKSPIEDHFQKYLNVQNVRTIQVNVSQPHTLYDFDETAIGSIHTKYSVNERLKDLVCARLDLPVAHYSGQLTSDEQVTEKLKIDLRLSFIRRQLPSIITLLPQNMVLDIYRQLIYSSNWLGQDSNSEALRSLKLLWDDYFPQSPDYSILVPVYQTLKEVGAPRDLLGSIFDKAALSRIMPLIDVDAIIELLRADQARDIDFNHLKKTIFKLATDQNNKQLEALLKQLLSSFASTTSETRQRSLRLAMAAVDALVEGAFWDIFQGFVKDMLRLAMSPLAGQEIIELIERVGEKTAVSCRWQELKLSLQALRGIARETANPKSTEASSRLQILASSQVLSDILVDGVITAKGGAELYEAIATLGSPRIANLLIEKIDCNDKAIRARIIKALVGMGKESGQPVTEALAAIVNKGETEDDKVWYRLRNLIRVIGLVKYIEALPYFEIMGKWNQKRIKLELISALESMHSASAGPILCKLSIDPDLEIRKAAIVGMGMSGHPDMITYIKHLFGHIQIDKVLLVAALGRIGGPRARDVLIDLYENDSYFGPSKFSRKEEEAIKMAIIRAMAKIGDDVSKSKVDLYSRQWLNKDKSMKSDFLSNTARILLGDNPNNKS